MRILLLHQYFLFPDQNGGTRSYDLAKSFVEKGYEVTVISATSINDYQSKKGWTIIQREGIEVHYIYIPYGNQLSYPKRIRSFIKFMIASTRHVLKLKGDIVLATSTPLTIGIPALIKKKYHKTPFIFEVRDVWPEAVIAIGAIKNNIIQKALYKLEKTIYKNATAVVPLSVDMKTSIDLRYPSFRSKTTIVIPNISEIDRFQARVDSSNIIEETIGFKPNYTVLYAGTFGKVNGIHKIIELANQTIKEDPLLVYVLMGSGAEKENIRALAKKKKVLNKNVFILEPVVKSKLPIWYNAASTGSSFVVDIKELWANSANKFFDTLAAGKPILINHEGWQAKKIRSQNIGYVLPFNVNKVEAKNFVNYTKDSNLHKIQSENALKLAKSEYALEIASQKYIKIFNSIENV